MPEIQTISMRFKGIQETFISYVMCTGNSPEDSQLEVVIKGLCEASYIQKNYFWIGWTYKKRYISPSRVGPIYRLADIFGRYKYRYIGIGKWDIGIGHIGIGICIG